MDSGVGCRVQNVEKLMVFDGFWTQEWTWEAILRSKMKVEKRKYASRSSFGGGPLATNGEKCNIS